MEQINRQKKDYLGLSRWEIQNFYRSHLLNDAKYQKPLKPTIRYRIKNFLNGNILGWLGSYILNRFGKLHKFETYSDKADTGIYPIDTSFKIALLSDWATNTDEAIAIAKIAKNYDPDYSIHLGDIYYVGNKQEVINNFDPTNDVWQYGKQGSLALPGNHEFYANGNAFYEVLLKNYMGILNKDQIRVPQTASFFCLENEHWRVIGLDTGYHSSGTPLVEFLPFCAPNCRLHKKQLEWLQDVVKINDPSDKRGIIFMGHHQYYCAFGSSYPKQARQIKDIMDKAARPVIWFWGHEHVLAFYDKNNIGNGIETYGRCIGNGGMPINIIKALKRDKTKKIKLNYYDARHCHTVEVPRFFSFLKPKNVDLGYNAFALLGFEGPVLKITYIDQEGTVLMEEHWRPNVHGGVELFNIIPSPLLKVASRINAT